MLSTQQERISAKEWNNIVKKNVQSMLGVKLDGEFIAANYPAGFNYAIKQTYYNADTLSTLDLLVTMSDGIPTLSNSYSSLYKNVIEALEYGLSSKDKLLLAQEATEQKALVDTIIDEYKESGLEETPKAYPDVMYIIKQIKEKTGADFLHVNMLEYPNLLPLCRGLSEYTRHSVFTYKLGNAWSIADAKIKAISANITTPSETNGGLKTDGKTYNIGWIKFPQTAQLYTALTQGNTLSFSLSSDNFSGEDSTLHFENDISVRVPFNWFFNIKSEHHDSYNLSKFSQHESRITVTITFSGITTFAAIPSPLSNDNEKGWFASDILNEAAKKSGKDATGYRLHGGEFDPESLFGEDGELRRLKTFVISQQPSIQLHFDKFDCKELKEFFTQETNVSFNLFGGLINGQHNNGYSFSNFKYDAQKESMDVSLTPAPFGSSGSIDKQTAFILGGVAETFK